jgi:hypothetical protein
VPANGQEMIELSQREGTQPSFWRRWGGLILGALLSIGAIFWLASTLDFQQLLLRLRDVNYAWLVVGLLTVLLHLNELSTDRKIEISYRLPESKGVHGYETVSCVYV